MSTDKEPIELKLHRIKKEIQEKFYKIKTGREREEDRNNKSLSPITSLLKEQIKYLSRNANHLVTNNIKKKRYTDGADNGYDVNNSIKKKRYRVNTDEEEDDDENGNNNNSIYGTPRGNIVNTTQFKTPSTNIKNKASKNNSMIKFSEKEEEEEVPSDKVMSESEKSHDDFIEYNKDTDDIEVGDDADISDEERNGLLINEFITSCEDIEWDTNYGPKLEDNKIVLGNYPLTFTNSHIIINYIKYNNSEGLQELIFKKRPDVKKITDEDITNYNEILVSSEKKIKGNSGKKYQTYIKPYRIATTGKGLMMSTSKNSKFLYKYWDDPNELVDRLRLLMALQGAGNNSYNNEIISIIEELKEAKIIL